MSDFSAYVNGEVVTIDGGEWLMGAGEFSHLDKVSEEMWDMLEVSRGKSDEPQSTLGLYESKKEMKKTDF